MGRKDILPCPFVAQESLGGNAKTFMVANISGAAAATAHTFHTLEFAQLAKRVRNKV